MLATITAFLSAHPEIVGFVTYLLVGIVAQALRGTALGALLQALGLDLSKLRAVPAAAVAPPVAPATAPPSVVITELPPSAPRVPPAAVLVLALGALFARDLVACTPAARATAATVVTAVSPLACATLATVVDRGSIVAQLCDAAAKAAADLLLAQSKAAGGVPVCGEHVTIADTRGAVVGWACASLAPSVAKAIGGQVVK